MHLHDNVDWQAWKAPQHILGCGLGMNWNLDKWKVSQDKITKGL
jgi:hypothetical protein